MPRWRNKESGPLLAMGTGILGVGLFFGLGLMIWAGAAMMIAGILPPTGKKDDPF